MDSNFIAEPQQNFNPLQQVGQVVGVQNQLLENKQRQLTMGANQAYSQAIQQATNPDGTIDYAKLHSLAAANPRAGYNLNAEEAQSQGTQNATTANQQQLLSLTHDRLATVGQRLSGLAADPNTTADDVRQSMGQLVKDGIVSPDRAIAELQNIPDDQSKVHGYLFSHAQQLASAAQQLQMAEGDWQMVNVGGHQIAIQRNPQAQGGAGVAGVFNNELTPGEKADQIQVTGPDGRPYMVPKSSLLQQEGVNNQGETEPNYGMPGYDHPQGGPGAPNVPGAVPAGPSPQEQQAWTAATQRQQQREQEALSVPNRIAGLDQAGQALANMKDTDWAAGPKSQELSHVIGALNTLGVHVDQNSINSRQTMVKYLENAINTSAQEAGFNGSNDRLNAWAAGQPDPNKMGPQALKAAMAYVRSQAVGQSLMSQFVRGYVAQNGPNSVAQAEQVWGQHYDANALYLATLPAAQRNKVLSKMETAQATQTRQHFADMISNGLVHPQDIARYGQADAGE